LVREARSIAWALTSSNEAPLRAKRAAASTMVPWPSVHDWLSTTAIGISSATARAASSALCSVADRPLLRLITTMPVAPSAISSR